MTGGPAPSAPRPPGPAASASRRRARVRGAPVLGLLLALAATVVLGACGGIIGSFVATRDALSAAGYSKVSVGISGDNNLKVSATVDQNTSAGEIQEIASIVWRDFHQRFGSLEVTLHAANVTVRQVLPFSELQRQIGSRSPADNKTSIRASILRTGIVVLVASVLVVAAVVVIAVVVVRRRRRRRHPPAGPPPPDGGPGPGSGPGPGRGPGWPGRGPADGGGPGPETPWGAPVPAPVGTPGPQDPWEPPPGSGPPAWSRAGGGRSGATVGGHARRGPVLGPPAGREPRRAGAVERSGPVGYY